jgi:hypothetical protein
VPAASRNLIRVPPLTGLDQHVGLGEVDDRLKNKLSQKGNASAKAAQLINDFTLE